MEQICRSVKQGGSANGVFLLPGMFGFWGIKKIMLQNQRLVPGAALECRVSRLGRIVQVAYRLEDIELLNHRKRKAQTPVASRT